MAILKKKVEEEKYKDIIYINKKANISEINSNIELFNKKIIVNFSNDIDRSK